MKTAGILICMLNSEEQFNMLKRKYDVNMYKVVTTSPHVFQKIHLVFHDVILTSQIFTLEFP